MTFKNQVQTIILLSVLFMTVIPVIAQNPEDLILNQERKALDRWKLGDTFGFIEIAADDITYFDPTLEERITGIEQFRKFLASFNGTFSFPRYELLNPRVQLYATTGVLTFNFRGYSDEGKENNWNATEVYHIVDGIWKLASSHWSKTKPVQ